MSLLATRRLLALLLALAACLNLLGPATSASANHLPALTDIVELVSNTPRLSDKMLTTRLRELEELALIVREDLDGHDRYRLTARGESLRHVLQSLYDWGLAHADELSARLAE